MYSLFYIIDVLIMYYEMWYKYFMMYLMFHVIYFYGLASYGETCTIYDVLTMYRVLCTKLTVLLGTGKL